jgi:hypothetical protein
LVLSTQLNVPRYLFIKLHSLGRFDTETEIYWADSCSWVTWPYSAVLWLSPHRSSNSFVYECKSINIAFILLKSEFYVTSFWIGNDFKIRISYHFILYRFRLLKSEFVQLHFEFTSLPIVKIRIPCRIILNGH